MIEALLESGSKMAFERLSKGPFPAPDSSNPFKLNVFVVLNESCL